MSVFGAAACLPVAHCGSPNNLGQPQFLKASLGEALVKDIGKLYTEKFPFEADVKKLPGLIKVKDNDAVATAVKNDFQQGKVVEMKGWILSVTEARQAALYYLNS